MEYHKKSCLPVLNHNSITRVSNMAFVLALGNLYPVVFPGLSHPPYCLVPRSLIRVFYLFHAQGQVSGAHLAPALSHFT